jgi:hypothetical protein
MNKYERRDAPEAQADLLAITVDQMQKGWTDRGIKRSVAASTMYQAGDSRVQALIDEARLQCRVPDPETPDLTKVPIIASPYVWRDPVDIPRREWLYAHRLLRKFTTATVGAGGTCKSSLEIAEVVSMVSGRALFGDRAGAPLRVWYYNLEDPLVEVERHVQATCLHYKVKKADVEQSLFISSGRDQPLVIAETTKTGAVVCHPVVDTLVEQITTNRIDVLVIDPFVSCHQVTENDNNAIDLVTKEWGRVADRGNCAVELVHHVRKGDGEVTFESARGGGSFGDACRMVRVINRMTKEEAVKAGVDNHREYFRAYIDKGNLAPPAERSDWFRMASVHLGNAPAGEEDDNVGVALRWDWPDHAAGATEETFAPVAEMIRTDKWRDSAQAPGWVGYAVARALHIDLVTAKTARMNKARVKALLKTWKEGGLLKTVKGLDDNRVERTFVEVVG